MDSSGNIKINFKEMYPDMRKSPVYTFYIEASTQSAVKAYKVVTLNRIKEKPVEVPVEVPVPIVENVTITEEVPNEIEPKKTIIIWEPIQK